MADSATANNQRRQGFGALSQHVSTHKLEMGLWATRILTIFFTVAYFLPIFPSWLAGAHPVAAYHKVSTDVLYVAHNFTIRNLFCGIDRNLL